MGDDDIDLSINNSPSENENKEENDWVKVLKKSKKNGDKKTWEECLNILHGTAVGDNEAPHISLCASSSIWVKQGYNWGSTITVA